MTRVMTDAGNNRAMAGEFAQRGLACLGARGGEWRRRVSRADFQRRPAERFWQGTAPAKPKEQLVPAQRADPEVSQQRTGMVVGGSQARVSAGGGVWRAAL